jgi:CBS domain-containing protein
MLAKECMTKNVKLGEPSMSLADAAKMMKEGDFGILPISDHDRLVGMITDRDIAVRGIAEGKSIVGEVMTSKVLYCFDDQDVEDVIKNLGENQVRRLPVLNRQKRLVGILSLGNLAQSKANPKIMEEALTSITKKK